MREVFLCTFLYMETKALKSRRFASWLQEVEIDRLMNIADEKEKEELNASDNSEKLPDSIREVSPYATSFQVGDIIVLSSRHTPSCPSPVHAMVVDDEWGENEGVLVPFSQLSYAARPKEYELLSELGCWRRVAVCDMSFSFSFSRIQCWKSVAAKEIVRLMGPTDAMLYCEDVNNIVELYRSWITGKSIPANIDAQLGMSEIPSEHSELVLSYQAELHNRVEEIRATVIEEVQDDK